MTLKWKILKMKNKYFFALIPIFLLGASLFSTNLASSSNSLYSITTSAFEPVYYFTEYENQSSRLYLGLNESSTKFNAPVNLPDGVIVERLIFYWKDQNSEHNGWAEFGRTDFTGLGKVIGESAETRDLSVSGNSTGVINTRINNSTYGYYVSITLLPSITAYGIQLEYSYQVYLPTIFKNNFQKFIEFIHF